jgi:hypothetical protein
LLAVLELKLAEWGKKTPEVKWAINSGWLAQVWDCPLDIFNDPIEGCTFVDDSLAGIY